jgi:hypothetical protein
MCQLLSLTLDYYAENITSREPSNNLRASASVISSIVAIMNVVLTAILTPRVGQGHMERQYS